MSGNKSRKLRLVAKHIVSQDTELPERRVYQRLKKEYQKELNTINNHN